MASASLFLTPFQFEAIIFIFSLFIKLKFAAKYLLLHTPILLLAYFFHVAFI